MTTKKVPASVEDIPETGDAAPLPAELISQGVLDALNAAVAKAYAELVTGTHNPGTSPAASEALKQLLDVVHAKLQFDAGSSTWREK